MENGTLTHAIGMEPASNSIEFKKSAVGRRLCYLSTSLRYRRKSGLRGFYTSCINAYCWTTELTLKMCTVLHLLLIHICYRHCMPFNSKQMCNLIIHVFKV